MPEIPNPLPCGCEAKLITRAYEVDHAEVEFCPKHAAVDDLIAALKIAESHGHHRGCLIYSPHIGECGCGVDAARAALKKAGIS